MRRTALVLGLLATAAAVVGTQASARPDPRVAALGGPPGGFAAYHAVTVTTNDKDVVPYNKAVSYKGVKPVYESHYVGRKGAEPTIGVDQRNRAYFPASDFDAVPGKPPANSAHTILLSSGDRGKTWRSVQPVIANQDGHPASLDPYVYVDPKTGRVFDIDLTGVGSELSYSDDSGETWTTTTLTSTTGVNDHQTLFSAAVPAGNPTLIPQDPKYKRIVYYCVNSVAVAGCAHSIDGGRTFSQAGGAPFPTGFSTTNGFICGSLHGHGVGDSKGRIFLPQGRCGIPTLAISEDGGLTWNDSVVSPGVHTAGTQSAVAVDAADNVYYTWWDNFHHLPYLAVSRDHGKTWGKSMMIAPPGVHEVNWPTIDAGDAGRIAITFPGTTVANDDDDTKPPTDKSRPWNSYVVLSTNATSSNPLFLSNIANPTYDPIHRGDCFDRCGTMYDFLDIVVAPGDQGRVWATAVDTCTADKKCKSSDVPGNNDGTGSYGASEDMQGVAIRQVAGPALRGRATYLARDKK